MLTEEIRQYLKEQKGKLTPLEFIALVNSSQDTIKEILLENADAIYTISTKDGKKMDVEIVKEPKKLELKRDSN